MRVRTLLFANLRELAGASHLDVDLPEGSRVLDLLEVVGAEAGSLAQAAHTAAVAVNQEYAGPERVLSDGDEVALIPPVAGG